MLARRVASGVQSEHCSRFLHSTSQNARALRDRSVSPAVLSRTASAANQTRARPSRLCTLADVGNVSHASQTAPSTACSGSRALRLQFYARLAQPSLGSERCLLRIAANNQPVTLHTSVRFLCLTPVRRLADEAQEKKSAAKTEAGDSQKAFHVTNEELSKAQRMLAQIKSELREQSTAKSPPPSPKGSNGALVEVKPGLWVRFKHWLVHTKDGFKLFWVDMKVSYRYMSRVLHGHTLKRAERRQLIRTLADMFRMVPFTAMILIPAAELALPFLMYFFPNLLPTQFQNVAAKTERLRKQTKVKLEMARFLQDTIYEMSVERRKRQLKDGESPVVSRAQEFSKFTNSIREEGGYVSNKDLLRFIDLFEDDLTLDNLSWEQLRALGRIVHIPMSNLPTPNMLRFQLNIKLKELRYDDRSIAEEGGVEALSVSELQEACFARGMRSTGLSEQKLRRQLKSWLELSLDDKVPGSLLLLSRTLYLPETVTHFDRLKHIVATLPDSISQEARLKLSELEGDKVDPSAKLQVITSIEKALQLDRDIEEKAVKDSAALQAMTAKRRAEMDPEAEFIVDKILKKKHDAPAAIDQKDIDVVKQVLKDAMGKNEIADVIEELKADRGKHDKEIAQLISNDVHDGEVTESKLCKTVTRQLDRLIQQMESELYDVLSAQQQRCQPLPAVEGMLNEKRDYLVSIEELMTAVRKLSQISSAAKYAAVQRVLHALDHDQDGLVDVDVAFKVVDMLARELVEVSGGQLEQIIGMLHEQMNLNADEGEIDQHQPGAPVNRREQILRAGNLLAPTWCYIPPATSVDVDMEHKSQQLQRLNGSPGNLSQAVARVRQQAAENSDIGQQSTSTTSKSGDKPQKSVDSSTQNR